MKMTALAKTIETLLENKKYSSLRDVLSSMNEADIAAMFSEGSSDSLPLLFRLLPKDLAADTFALMDTDEQELLIRGFSDNEIKEVFDELYVDDAADIVEEMPANVVKRILKNTEPDMRQMINEILKYPEDSAGSLMTTDYISLRPKMTISDAIKRIRRTINEAETIYTCYVTDDNRKLLGYLSVKISMAMVSAPPSSLFMRSMTICEICSWLTSGIMTFSNTCENGPCPTSCSRMAARSPSRSCFSRFTPFTSRAETA